MTNYKLFRKIIRGLITMYYPSIRLEGLRKTTVIRMLGLRAEIRT
jgi:hypothetical protein